MFSIPNSFSPPIVSEHVKRGNILSNANLQNIVQCMLVLLLLQYIFASSTILLSLFSITLYIEVERNASCFFLEALTLTTVLSFVYSSLFTYQQGCEVPGLVCSLLLLQQHWYTALDLMICCHQPQVMKWRKCVTRNTNLPDFRILSLIQNVMNLCF